MKKLLIIAVTLLTVMGLVISMGLIVEFAYGLYLDSLTLEERVALLKNGNMSLETKLTMFRQ